MMLAMAGLPSGFLLAAGRFFIAEAVTFAGGFAIGDRSLVSPPRS